MKKIIRLTESDLTRIVKRVISESTDEEKYQKLYDAVDGLGTNERVFVSTIESIKDKAEYDRINAIAKSKGEDIVALFDGDFGFGTSYEYFNRFCTKLHNLGVPLSDKCSSSNIKQKRKGITFTPPYGSNPKLD